MTAPTAFLTDLDAVNMMLSSIGQAPVNSLDVTGIRDVSIASLILDNVTREVLLRGLSFNTDYEYELTPDGSDEIVIPTTCLKLDPVYDTKDYVMRWNVTRSAFRMYDRENKTFTISDTVKVDITWGFEFNQIPLAARNYIAMRAARRFQNQAIGSEILYKFTQQDENEALAAMKRDENSKEDLNMLHSGSFTSQIFQRRRNP